MSDQRRREGLIGEAIRAAKQARRLTLRHLAGLTPADLSWRAAPDANTVQWLVWHVAEVEETVLWTLEGRSPEWRFGRSALKERGAEAHLPPPEELQAYAEDVRTRFLAWLQAMAEADLERTFGTGPWQGSGRGLVFLPPRHETHHGGQISFIRRLMGKPVADENYGNPYQ